MGDCLDSNAAVNPDAQESCGDDLDNDCAPTTNCFWAEIGGESHAMTTVKSGQGAVNFYSFGDPVGGGSNTGFESANVAQLFLHEGPNGGLSLFVLMGDAGDDGGQMNLAITNMPGANVGVLVADDATEVGMVPNAPGSAAATWKWVECCTDGGVFGPLDGAFGWEITLQFTIHNGIDTLVIRNGDGQLVTVADPSAPIVLKKLSNNP